jgi:hypothetical protein
MNYETGEELKDYLEKDEYFYRLLIQISTLGPYGMMKFERYSIQKNEVVLDTSDVPYLPEHYKFMDSAKKFFNTNNIDLLKDDILQFVVPGVVLELREGEPSVYNCLFEDLASFYPYA